MSRFKSTDTGVVVSVADAKDHRFGNGGWERVGDNPAAAPSGYADQKVAELRDEIDRRNEDRAEDDQLSTEGNKADLIATLEADDAE